jgi:hypothetical protein
MRHLLGGAAIAALLAAGLPAAAQTNGAAKSTPPAATSDQSAPGNAGMSSGDHQNATSGATTDESGTKTKHKKHAAKHKGMKATKTTKTSARHQPSAADNMAEQLNREELDKVEQNGRMPTSGTSSMPNNTGGGAMQPANGANSMPGTVTSHGKEQPQQ